MNRLKSLRPFTIPLLVLSFLILLITCLLLSMGDNKNSLSHNTDQMLEKAIDLREKGNKDAAIQQLLLYCTELPHDNKGFLLLGDWYMEDEKPVLAYQAYKRAALTISCKDDEIGESDRVKRIPDNYSGFQIKIYPNARYTKDMTLTISGENLTPDSIMEGLIDGQKHALAPKEGILTTDWFMVDSAQKDIKIITDSRGSAWQFMDKDGNIISNTTITDIRDITNVNLTTPAYTSVEIPGNAVKARVSYSSAGNKNPIITYGSDLTGYTDSPTQTYRIPDLTEGQYICYSHGAWILYDGEHALPLDWETPVLTRGSFYGVDGTLCGAVSITGDLMTPSSYDKQLQYGIRYSTISGITICERLGDARGMNFNYVIGDSWAKEGENGFDTAYPWCEMKLCNIRLNGDGSQSIIYEDDPSFSTDGSNGNVMVEIPKFYTKRTVENGFEEIWISGTKHEGYVLDYIFEGKNNEELEHVYIGAYIGSKQGYKIISASGTYPVLGLNYQDTLNYADNNGTGYSEMSYLLCTALQKLFLVETGTLDSTSLFAGETDLPQYADVDAILSSFYAARDDKDTNTITLYNNTNTQKFAEGSSLLIMQGKWNTYDDATAIRREITKITSNNNYIYVTFDGDPIDIYKHQTAVSAVPSLTGKTNTLKYCTGSLEGELGKVGFKYRNIENLYGSALIMLDDDAYVKNSLFYYYDGKRALKHLPTPLSTPDNNLTNANGANSNSCIKEMTYDSNHSLIMLPSVSGKNANVYSYYGDLWQYSDSAEPKYLTYGGTYDNLRMAGLFHMRAVATSDWSTYYSSSRIMYR